MALWGRRRWLAAVLGALGTALATGLPTVMIPNPVFSRMVPVTAWDRPVWVVTSVLAGLLVATYVTPGGAAPGPDDPDGATADGELDTAGRRGGIGAVMTYFAIGCPVCNKLVVLALGTSGAMSWFAPAQPLLAAGSIALLAWALRTRLRAATACGVPAAPG